MEVQVRRVGNSLVLPLPNSDKISKGMKFSVERYTNGSIVYTPVKENLFENPAILQYADDYRQNELLLEEDIE
ncbi:MULTISPECIES: antitoxin of toxin-antitoxin stability system [Aerococcus]|uniref:antitoxin of toxin-antitoxin stability system n=1 Tax=Aerococcus TaxID=1375 RepID=UPI000DCCCAE8|nr:MULTISPECIES: antitoxin of toxin-antitoxin stability system [Aerococcus]KAA9297525.1 antitoxin of toxin-antitoxin stability system [Aerococcus tenax]MDK6688189.1 antitoxin of toxin-antitoxin stability system [Aerococcus urinae]MDK8132691.1 antitoxin of toxin-antitoxin stability system [Aerococcus urinae]MDK8484388.1 antitoxin of toxin-antitoxin stability system [Aerococcus urinae]MDL5179329.1 antitoxin of toxin-antitoxin stability system [Aerococcus tenax]